MRIIKRYICSTGGALQPSGGLALGCRASTLKKLKINSAPKKRGSNKSVTCQANRTGNSPVFYIATKPFGTVKEKTSLQNFLSNIPSGLAYVGAFVVIAIGAAGGWVAGSSASEKYQKYTGIMGSVAGASLGVLAMVKASETRESGATVDIYNLIVTKGDPSALTRTDVEKIEQKYGSSISKNLLYVSELKSIYDRYLESMIPSGELDLKGDEPEKIRSFKAALGISDEDAAAVHMDVGRRFSRSTFEEGRRADQVSSRKRFQRWIYISYRVFGERKAAFLLPLARVFNLNVSQVAVARRDNAKAVFKSKIIELGGVLKSDREFLKSLRKYQTDIQLTDEVAEETIKEFGRKRVESGLSSVMRIIRERTRAKDYSQALKEIDEILLFNRELDALSKEADSSLPPGLGRFTIHGGAFEKASSTADQREIFQVFLSEKLATEGQFTVKLGSDLDELSAVLGLGVKEAEKVRYDVCSEKYKELLREEISSGRLDSAESKADILQKLCNRLQFRPEMAAAIHKAIFKQRVETYLRADNCITEENNSELQRVRKLLCIGQSDIDEVMKETVGAKFRVVVDEVLAVGTDNFNDLDIENVAKAMDKFKMNETMAKEILSSCVRKYFLQFVSNSRIQRNKLDAAKELKKMVYYNVVVVTPLLKLIKSWDLDVTGTMKKLSETLAKASEEVIKENALKDIEGEEKKPAEDTVPATLEKASKAKEFMEGAQGEDGKPVIAVQKEITLSEDIALQERIDMYRNYLLFCMTGETIRMPMGGTLVVEREADEFGRLSQLGDILGLSPINVMNVHTDLAEQAFRQQVKSVMIGGQITNDTMESLADIQNKMGLSKTQADKIIKSVQGEYLAGSLQSAKAMGQLTLQKLIDMKDSGVEISSFTSAAFRQKLYQTEAEKLLSDGKGQFDAEYMLKTLPEDIQIDPKAAKATVLEIARTKKKLQIVQAMSDLRLKNFDSVVNDINNIIACSKVSQFEEEPKNGKISWDRRDEVLDLYSVYYWKVKDESKLVYLQEVLDITPGEAETLKKIVDSGQLAWTKTKDNEIFF